MKRISILFYTFTLLLLFTGCTESNSVSIIKNCNKQSQVIDDATYNLVGTSNYTITRVALNQDCLDITVSSSGCNANNWQMNLFSTNNFPDSPTLQRNLKVELVNEEACLTVLTKTISFDLVPLRVGGEDQITLNIQRWAQPVVYNY